MAIRTRGGDQVVDRMGPVLPTWGPPAIVVFVSISIVGAFYIGGPGLGMAIGALAAAAIIVLAVRAAPRGPIVPAALTDLRRHLLIVSRDAIEDPQALAQIAELSRGIGPDPTAGDVRVLISVRERSIDRWCSDRVAHSIAQRNAVISLAGLVKVDIEASATVGDGDVVQAVEDELRTYPATDVLMLTCPEDRDAAERSAAELRARLQADFLHLPVRASSPVENRRAWRLIPPAVESPVRASGHRRSLHRP
ncbi:MAG: hypothetical protein JST59_30400 [Actinobacteria bacterium]|nr:hypothetical protein [Actinomycetota bacterium]